MDEELRKFQRRVQEDPNLVWAYWQACKRKQLVTVETLITAIREIQTVLHREFAELYWPLRERRGLINSMDFRTPESTEHSIQKWINENASFHLTPCVCKAPMWQQPCEFCGYYPVGSGGHRPGTILTKEQFIEKLNGGSTRFQEAPAEQQRDRYVYLDHTQPRVPFPFNGNIAKLWVHERFFGNQTDVWRHRAHLIGVRAEHLVDSLSWPTASEVWDAYAAVPCGDPECLNNAETVKYVSRQDSGAPFITQVPYPFQYCYGESDSIRSHRYTPWN